MPFSTRLISINDDLDAVCAQMQPGKWGADNEMTSYQAKSLRKFLERGGLLVVTKDSVKIAGAALCYELPHPASEDSLYVHELDTHPDYRRQGVATAVVQEVFKIAKDRGLKEVWVGTETDNKAADAFYKSLKPYEVENSFIYAYKIKD